MKQSEESKELNTVLTSEDQWDWREIEAVLSGGAPASVLSALETTAQFAESVPHLLHRVVAILSHSNDPVRKEAARTIGFFGPVAVGEIPKLVALAVGEDRFVAGGALEGLGAIGRHAPEQVLSVIRDALRSEDGQTREDAITATELLGHAGGPLVGDLFPLLDDRWSVASSGMGTWPNCVLVPRALIAIGEAALPLVLARLEKEPREPHWGILETLEGLGAIAKDALPILRDHESALGEERRGKRLMRPELPARWVQMLPGFQKRWERRMEQYYDEHERRGLRDLGDRLTGIRRVIAAIDGIEPKEIEEETED